MPPQDPGGEGRVWPAMEGRARQAVAWVLPVAGSSLLLSGHDSTLGSFDLEKGLPSVGPKSPFLECHPWNTVTRPGSPPDTSQMTSSQRLLSPPARRSTMSLPESLLRIVITHLLSACCVLGSVLAYRGPGTNLSTSCVPSLPSVRVRFPTLGRSSLWQA